MIIFPRSERLNLCVWASCHSPFTCNSLSVEATSKSWQFNCARKINKVLNGGNFVQQDDSSRQSRNMKFYIAFRYCERLSMATNNLIALTALASYNGHQVVVPFVNDSQFFGYKMSSDDTQTLALYSTTI